MDADRSARDCSILQCPQQEHQPRLAIQQEEAGVAEERKQQAEVPGGACSATYQGLARGSRSVEPGQQVQSCQQPEAAAGGGCQKTGHRERGGQGPLTEIWLPLDRQLGRGCTTSLSGSHWPRAPRAQRARHQPRARQEPPRAQRDSPQVLTSPEAKNGEGTSGRRCCGSL